VVLAAGRIWRQLGFEGGVRISLDLRLLFRQVMSPGSHRL
jgi:hypothetical protein